MTDTAPTDDAATAPNDEADEQLAPERDGQATTVEEAMHAATDEEGFVDESAYTTPAGSVTIVDEAAEVDDD
jgi:hypothetical protein